MATTFPQQIQEFIPAMDITEADAPLIQQYQNAIERGDMEAARQILVTIPNGQNKFISADRLNTIVDTCYALEKYFAERYSPAYIVSETMPAGQEEGDFWFEVTGQV